MMKDYIILMANECLCCELGEPKCTEMECMAVHDVLEAFFPCVMDEQLN